MFQFNVTIYITLTFIDWLDLNLIKQDPNDFYDLNKNNKFDLLAHDLGFLEKGYATFCKNCYGCNTGIDLPVGPGKQGLRLSS